MHKAKEIGGMELPSHEESSLVLYPGEEALDDPSAPIAAQFAKVLSFAVLACPRK